MAENVKVAVRVRPFREKTRKAVLVVQMNGNTTEITNPDKKTETKKYTFDHSYWSHDGYKEKAGGYLEPANPKYADQKKVFDDLGKGVVNNAWKGYNCSLFAYGQTGSGKSYSMVGYGANSGIVPLVCKELFVGIEQKKKVAKAKEEFQVTFSMLEIYNEQVRDLLNTKSMKVKGGLKVRQHAKHGFYVEQLTSVGVRNYVEIEGRMQEGTKNRTVASTNMNATSSRAHTIVAISFTQKTLNESGQSMTKSSVVNLVDLAGSERATSSGATGDRLKEGASINLSLSTLGNCIKALADQSSGNKKSIVPYRDSVLTKLLKNALGGNSKTVMIAALSPADINYEETLSTLRFADRAKSIKTQATVNESPTDKLIRELREENEKLKLALQQGGETQTAVAGHPQEDGDGSKNDLLEQMRINQEEMETMQQSWEQKLAEKEKEYQASLDAQKKKKDQQKTVPHLWNLNEDPALTGMVLHFTPQGSTRVGSSKSEKPVELQLNGLGILPEHAVIVNKRDVVELHPSSGAKILLNGDQIKASKQIHHNDRILFGSNNLFVFHHPKDYAKQQKEKTVVTPPTYETAQEEIAKHSGLTGMNEPAKSKEDLLLQQELVELFPMVNECNAMSEELDKKVRFEIALIAPMARGKKEGRTKVCVKMRNLQNGNEWTWDRNTFTYRKYLMQMVYQNYAEGDVDWNPPEERDPFWEDPSLKEHLGNVHLYMQSLAYKIELEETLQITDYRGMEQGQLQIEVYPCTKDGKDIGDDFIDDPEELIGQSLYFKIRILEAKGISMRFDTTYCSYKFHMEREVETEEKDGRNPQYGHEKLFALPTVTKTLVDYLLNEALVVEVWGRQKNTKVSTGLNTKELMIREKTTVGRVSATADPLGELKFKMAVEANTYKKRMERVQRKLTKIQGLVDKANAEKQTTLKVGDVERVLRGGKRFKAVANIIAKSEKAKRESEKCHHQ